MKFNDLILTSLETRCVQSVSVGDTLYLMILLYMSKGSTARFFCRLCLLHLLDGTFTLPTILLSQKFVCLLILPLKTV